MTRCADPHLSRLPAAVLMHSVQDGESGLRRWGDKPPQRLPCTPSERGGPGSGGEGVRAGRLPGAVLRLHPHRPGLRGLRQPRSGHCLSLQPARCPSVTCRWTGGGPHAGAPVGRACLCEDLPEIPHRPAAAKLLELSVPGGCFDYFRRPAPGSAADRVRVGRQQQQQQVRNVALSLPGGHAQG